MLSGELSPILVWTETLFFVFIQYSMNNCNHLSYLTKITCLCGFPVYWNENPLNIGLYFMYFWLNSDQTTSCHKVGNTYLLLKGRMTDPIPPHSWIKNMLLNREFWGENKLINIQFTLFESLLLYAGLSNSIMWSLCIHKSILWYKCTTEVETEA